jgi:hypothetical protein
MITIGAGGCGIQVTCDFFEHIGKEHHIDHAGNYVGNHDQDLACR